MDSSGSHYLHEEVLLIALNDEKGTIAGKAQQYTYVLAGAMLAELLLANRIALEPGRKKLVNLLDASPLGNPVLDSALTSMHDAKRRKNLKGWVSKLAGMSDLKERIAEDLCRQGVLRKEQGTFLLLFSRTTYPEQNPAPEQEIISRLREAIFTDNVAVDTRTSLLISLTYEPGLLAIPFAARDLRGAKKRIKKICEDDDIGGATNAVIQEIQTAIVVAVIIPAVVTT